MYPKASAHSLALNIVVAPICLAVSSNFFNSAPLAPLNACTLAIASWNFICVFTTLAAIPITGTVTPAVKAPPTLVKASPVDFKPLKLLSALFISSFALFKLLLKSFISNFK